MTKHIRNIFSAHKKIFVAISKGMLAMIGIGVLYIFAQFLYSIFVSGYHYVFDIDELFYSQLTYLIDYGYTPYVDVYTGVYSPLFQWFTLPVFLLRGFTFDALYAGRILMMVVFVLRFVALFFLARALFNTKTAILFVPMALLDPFIVLVGTQYRPDNLMLCVFSYGLLTLAYALKKQKTLLFIISGVLFSLSSIILPKLVPTIALLLLATSIYLFLKGQRESIAHLLAGAIVTGLLYVLYLVQIGALAVAIDQILVTRSIYDAMEYPLHIFSLHRPDNWNIYGTSGKPITWLYVWMIPVLGFAGLYHVAHALSARRKLSPHTPILAALIISLPLQWIPLFYMKVVFVQYYMLVNWVFVLFGAYAIVDLIDVLLKKSVWRYLAFGMVGFLVCYMMYKSTGFNIERSHITSVDMVNHYAARWKQIPPDEAVFPGFLFRPLVWPIAYGSPVTDFPDSFYNKLPYIPEVLEVEKPRLLVSEYVLERMPVDVQEYIRTHYQRVEGDIEMMQYAGAL